MNKVVIYGGSFDPPHLAHLKLIEHIAYYLKPYKIIIVPSHKQPLKNKQTDAKHRFNMLKLMLKNTYEISSYELEKKETSYTVDTLNFFKNKYMDYDLYYLMGLDSFLNIHFWKEFEFILKNYNLIVASRKMDKNNTFLSFIKQYRKLKNFTKKIIYFNNFNYKISSSVIRFNIKNPIYLTKQVYNYIKEHNLYD